MLPAAEALKTELEQLLPGVSVTLEGTALAIAAKDLLAVSRCLKDTDRFAMDYLSNVTAVDYPTEQRIQMVYHLYSMSRRHGPLTLLVNVDRAQPELESVTPLWRSAEFQEREVYDLFGVRFQGHPDLRRILMWDGFEGHPMRRDYVAEDQDNAPEPAR